MTGIRNCEKELNWEAGASPAASIKTTNPELGVGTLAVCIREVGSVIQV